MAGIAPRYSGWVYRPPEHQSAPEPTPPAPPGLRRAPLPSASPGAARARLGEPCASSPAQRRGGNFVAGAGRGGLVALSCGAATTVTCGAPLPRLHLPYVRDAAAGVSGSGGRAAEACGACAQRCGPAGRRNCQRAHCLCRVSDTAVRGGRRHGEHFRRGGRRSVRADDCVTTVARPRCQRVRGPRWQRRSSHGGRRGARAG